MVGIFLTMVIYSYTVAQNRVDYPEMVKYRKWSFEAGPVFYNKARITPQYGNYTFKNRIIPGYNWGFEFDFHPEYKWSFIIGLIMAKEPALSIKYHILKQDLYSQYTEDMIDHHRMNAIVTFSVPLLYRLTIPSSGKSYLTFKTGIKLMYFPEGNISFGLHIVNADGTETREIFGIKAHSQESPLYESFVISTGLAFPLHKILIKANAMYVMNFQNTMEGEYLFDNLLTSTASRGTYKLSGNYLGLIVTVNLVQPD